MHFLFLLLPLLFQIFFNNLVNVGRTLPAFTLWPPLLLLCQCLLHLLWAQSLGKGILLVLAFEQIETGDVRHTIASLVLAKYWRLAILFNLVVDFVQNILQAYLELLSLVNLFLSQETCRALLAEAWLHRRLFWSLLLSGILNYFLLFFEKLVGFQSPRIIFKLRGNILVFLRFAARVRALFVLRVLIGYYLVQISEVAKST